MYGILIWLAIFVLPGAITAMSLKLFGAKNLIGREAFIIHLGLIISICLSQYVIFSLGYSFPWKQAHFSYFILVFSILFGACSLGTSGIWYGLSSILQQITLLSAVSVLLHFFPIYIVILLIVPVFALGHTPDTRFKYIKTIAVLSWGICSILVFYYTQDVYLVSALHAILGSFLISKSFLYSNDKIS